MNSTPESSQPLPHPVPNMPEEIGGYRIQRVLGSGGMATVYAALQKQPRRVVALKVMKASIDMSGGMAAKRFKREIEILGKLRHPYIAQVYGAGIHDDGGGGVPFFVMEYVPGAKTIVEYVAAKQLGWRDRLKLFVKVCAAMEHGHRNKVIHRDLKPGNILVDEQGEPKIIDFGVAYAAPNADNVTQQTMVTEIGRLVGTLNYMSPEQLDLRLQDLDARCDVYALGVLLYKMLTGRAPHDLEGLPMYEAVRIIREESPRTPSAINVELRGDLETIILKAMEPDRSRRYRNAGSLGRDIVRFLANKPINARRASLVYRSQLFAKRHRTALKSGGIVAIVMSAALAIVLLTRDNAVDFSNPQTTPSAPAIVSNFAPPPAIAPAPIAFKLRQHTGTITQLAFLPDGTRIVSAGYDRSIHLWDIATRRTLAVASGLQNTINHCASNDDGQFIAAADRNSVSVMNGSSLQLVTRLEVATSLEVEAIAISPKGDQLAVALSDLTLRVFPISSATASSLVNLDLNQAMIYRSGTGTFTRACFSSDGKFIIAAARSGAVYLWNAVDGTQFGRRDDLKSEIAAIIATPDRLIAVAQSGRAISWQLVMHENAPLGHEFAATSSAPLSHAAFDPTGRWLACASGNEIVLWDVSTSPPQQVDARVTNDEVIHALAIDASGLWCAVGQANGDIIVIPVQH